jgi:multidrug efflux system membrane fusion protein
MRLAETQDPCRATTPFSRPGVVGVVATLCFLGVAVAAFLAGCSDKSAQGDNLGKAPEMVAPVTVGVTTQANVPVEVRVIGTGEAFSTVSVKSRVDGVIQRVHFVEGQNVKAGDLLFTIDSRPFQAALEQAQANLAKDQAQANNARLQAQRNSQLFQEGIISRDQYDTFRTNAAVLEAAVKADQAAVESAKINLGYCQIRSPITGRTGNLMVHEGNLVKSNDTTLVTINQITPIYVDFSVPEQYLPEIRKYGADGRLKVQVTIPSEENRPEYGVLTFINNTVDNSTGTVLLKGTFPNGSRRLWPGQFVDVTLVLSELRNAVVAPSQAVQTGQSGQYVYVVKPDNRVELQPVKTGTTYQGHTVITQGLQPGERVVTDGQLMLFPGAKVMIKEQAVGSQTPDAGVSR